MLTPQPNFERRALSCHVLGTGVFSKTIRNFEHGDSDPKLSTLHKWCRALEAAGGEFIESLAKSDEAGAGIRLRAEKAAVSAGSA